MFHPINPINDLKRKIKNNLNIKDIYWHRCGKGFYDLINKFYSALKIWKQFILKFCKQILSLFYLDFL